MDHDNNRLAFDQCINRLLDQTYSDSESEEAVGSSKQREHL